MNKITIDKGCEALYICGDIHGGFERLLYTIKQYGIVNAAVIVAGDCGFGFEKEEHYKNLYNKISRTLTKLNIFILMVRGNHDDPAYFDGRRINYKRFKCISDYSVFAFNEKNILCVGGGISIDRTMRKMDMDYTVWLPIEDKCGEWELITMLDGKEVARMKFNLFNPNILND